MIGEWGEMFYKQWEKVFVSLSDQLARNQAFLAQMGKLIEGSTIFKMVVETSILKALESLHIPSKKDMDEMQKATLRIEEMLSRQESMLKALAGRVEEIASRKCEEQVPAGESEQAAPSAKRTPRPKRTK